MHTSRKDHEPGERGSAIDTLQPIKKDSTESIDIENLFTLSKDVTTSGSFDLRQVKQVSFGKLLESIPLPTFLVDKSHRIVFANDVMAHLADDTYAVVGTTFSSLFPGPADAERATAILDAILEDRKTKVFEGLAKIESRVLWSRTHLRSIRFRKERLVLAIIEDLTAEKKQLIVNEKYHRLVQIFPIGIAEFALTRSLHVDNPPDESLQCISEAKLIGGNTEFARVYGSKSIEQLKGLALSELFPFDSAHQLLYRMWIKSRFPIRSFETRDETADEGVRYYENTLVGNLKKDYLNGLWGMRQDISHRKKIEEDLRAARDELEERVRERTLELLRTNEQLRLEVSERERAEQELAKLVSQLQGALAKVKDLSGLLPICSSCKKIRDDRGYWTQVEVYVREHSNADFTHSICPECARRLYPDLYDTMITHDNG